MADLTPPPHPSELPVLPLRRTVAFPLTLQPLAVNRPVSVESVNRALGADRLVLLLLQVTDADEPTPQDVVRVGTVGVIRQMAKSATGINIIIEGVSRVRADTVTRTGTSMRAQVTPLPEAPERTIEIEAHVRRLQELIDKALSLATGLSEELRAVVINIEDPLRLVYVLATLLDLKATDKQALLEENDLLKKLELISAALTREISLLELKGKIESQAQQEMSDAQRQYYLRQQLKAIQQELGEGEGTELADLRKRIEEAKLPEPVHTPAMREVDRLARMGPASPEYQMIRTYIDWLLDVPWAVVTTDRIDPVEARRVLDEDHYDLDKVKERIVEYLAVRKLKGDMKGPILCFVGPPGVGKTSLGQSIARAMSRRFVRISLGGVRDEAEIRGHRRTYIGSIPGRIVQALKQAGSMNPVFMLDEIDKVSVGFQGDPAAALLEVLDPAQNHTFRDHYLEIPVDLSRVLFIATSNQLGTIHPALHDRMEIIPLSGYTEEEKAHIARKYLLPRQMSEHGLPDGALELGEAALRLIIAEYTREAGVRNLERQLGTICRKVAARLATRPAGAPPEEKTEVGRSEVDDYLGPARFKKETAFRTSRPGVATGVAWTETGGDVLFIEATLLPGGNQNIILTGQLGNVMQESARAALSHLRARAMDLGIAPEFLAKHDLHVHVPAGAIPKDGPSAGVTMATAILSAARNRPVRQDVAMTGEITLSGLVLPVGGIREKALAARRFGIRTLILPALNEPDLEELPEEIRRDMTFVPVETLEQVIKVAIPDMGKVDELAPQNVGTDTHSDR
ncbi:MAG: endopeptidase La [Acidobacteria bacterium RIFCSPLOWO2_12_FULL_68_19]|nr:MAG: endopeptidase La [Acidobacteria bacterium RIFCSPLOWO2_12_FULL_68_19]